MNLISEYNDYKNIEKIAQYVIDILSIDKYPRQKHEKWNLKPIKKLPKLL